MFKSTTSMTRFVKDILRYSPASFLPAILGLIASATFTRTFSPSEYGKYSLVLAIIGPLTIIVTEWAAQPISRFYAEYLNQGKEEEYQQIVATLALMTGLAIVILATFVILVLMMVGTSAHQLLLYIEAALVLLTQSMTAIIMPLLTASHRPIPYRRAVVTSSYLSFGISLVLIHAFYVNIEWILVGQITANIIVFPYICKNAKVNIFKPIIKFEQQTIDIIIRFWHYGSPMILWFISSGILYAEDRYIIQMFRSSEEVGIYSASYGLVAGVSGLLKTPILMSAGPILYHQWAKGHIKQAEETIARMTEMYFILSLALLGGFIVTGVSIIDVILGEKFRSGSSILVPVLIGQIFWGASLIGHKSLELHEKTKQMVFGSLLAALSNLILNLFLVRFYGYIAAAYTTLASYAIYAGITWLQSRSLIPWKINCLNLLYYVAAMLSSVILTIMLVPSLLVSNPFAHIFISGSIFTIGYVTLLILFSYKHITKLIQQEVL